MAVFNTHDAVLPFFQAESVSSHHGSKLIANVMSALVSIGSVNCHRWTVSFIRMSSQFHF